MNVLSLCFDWNIEQCREILCKLHDIIGAVVMGKYFLFECHTYQNCDPELLLTKTRNENTGSKIVFVYILNSTYFKSNL